MPRMHTLFKRMLNFEKRHEVSYKVKFAKRPEVSRKV